MILIPKVKEYADSLVTNISDLKKRLFVIDDSQLAKELNDITDSDNLILVAFVPSHVTDGTDVDNAQNIDSMLWLVLSKFDKNEGQERFIDEMARCQLAANAIQKKMYDDKVNFSDCRGVMKQLQAQSLQIDPIWDLFSCIGYEIEYKLKTSIYQ